MKKYLKKSLALLLALMMAVSAMSVMAFAEPEMNPEDSASVAEEEPQADEVVTLSEVVDSGNCGDDLIWVLYSDGTMIISGTGDMYDYSYGSAPWLSVTSVVIENGATSIGAYAFSSCVSLISVEIPDSVTSIGDDAFFSCNSLENVNIPNNITGYIWMLQQPENYHIAR